MAGCSLAITTIEPQWVYKLISKGEIIMEEFEYLKVSNIMLAALREIENQYDRVFWNITQKEVHSPFGNTGERFSCDVFEVQAYEWNEDDEQLYNFKWNDIEIRWYKYLGRGMYQNRLTSNDEIAKMIDSCLDYLYKIDMEHRSKF